MGKKSKIKKKKGESDSAQVSSASVLYFKFSLDHS